MIPVRYVYASETPIHRVFLATISIHSIRSYMTFQLHHSNALRPSGVMTVSLFGTALHLQRITRPCAFSVRSEYHSSYHIISYHIHAVVPYRTVMISGFPADIHENSTSQSQTRKNHPLDEIYNSTKVLQKKTIGSSTVHPPVSWLLCCLREDNKEGKTYRESWSTIRDIPYVLTVSHILYCISRTVSLYHYITIGLKREKNIQYRCTESWYGKSHRTDLDMMVPKFGNPSGGSLGEPIHFYPTRFSRKYIPLDLLDISSHPIPTLRRMVFLRRRS